MGKIVDSNIAKRLPTDSLIARLDRGDIKGLAQDFQAVFRAKIQTRINQSARAMRGA